MSNSDIRDTKPTREDAAARANEHGVTRLHDGYAEAVTELKSLERQWGAAAMYRNSFAADPLLDTYVVYAWYDHDGRVRSGREQS